MTSPFEHHCYVDGCTEPPCAAHADGTAVCNTHSYGARSAYLTLLGERDALLSERAQGAHSVNIREVEAQSIRSFVQKAADNGYLSGRVLDYGCGKQPYRDIVGASALYSGFDPGVSGLGDNWRIEAPFDAILCTQVIEYAYWRGLGGFLFDFHDGISKGGYLVMTGPTNWPIVEREDRVRFTPEGIAQELREAKFEIIHLEERGRFSFGGDERWCLGWSVIARV